MDEQSSVEQPAVDSAQSVTDTLMDRWSEPDDTPADTAPDEDNAAAEGDDAPVEVEPETAPDEGLVEVEFEGKTHKVPQELKDALLRQSDYTRKTQEVAEARKQLEAQQAFVQQQAVFHQQSAQEFAQLQAVDNQLSQYQSIDWAAALDQDPIGANKAYIQFQQLQQARSQMAQALGQRQQQFQQAEAQQTAQAMEATRQHVQQLPGWTPQVDIELDKFTQGLPQFARVEIAKNPAIYEMVMKAWRYDQLQNTRPQVEKRVASLPKPVKPGSSESRVTDQEIQSKKAVSRLKQTGSPSALRDVLALRLKG